MKPLLADVTHAVPSLIRQKAEMVEQTVAALDRRRGFDGYAEIGSKGRYYKGLARALALRGAVYLVDESTPGYSPVDILERGRLARVGRHVPLGNYQPIAESAIPSASLDLVTCYVGLHHMTPEQLLPFLRSVQRVLRPGGCFIVRDHDVTTETMRAMVSLAHTVFNAGLGERWETNQQELRHFASVNEWVGRLAAVGLDDLGPRVLQDGDPTDNTLLAFVKRATISDQHERIPAQPAVEPPAHGMRVVGH